MKLRELVLKEEQYKSGADIMRAIDKQVERKINSMGYRSNIDDYGGGEFKLVGSGGNPMGEVVNMHADAYDNGKIEIELDSPSQRKTFRTVEDAVRYIVGVIS